MSDRWSGLGFRCNKFPERLGILSNVGYNVSFNGCFGVSDEAGSLVMYPYEISMLVIVFREIIYIPCISFVLGGSLCFCCHPGWFELPLPIFLIGVCSIMIPIKGFLITDQHSSIFLF